MSKDSAQLDVKSGDDDNKAAEVAVDQQQQRLIHPSLLKIPQQVRFGIMGAVGNVLFMIFYNVSILQLEHKYEASTIYAVVYFLYIPMGHALTCLFVFGWPKRYISSLLSNYPIGLTAMALGTACTFYLDHINFNERVEDFIREYISPIENVATDEDEKGEFYSSLVVLIITSAWTYVLSVIVNAPKEEAPKDKKEL